MNNIEINVVGGEMSDDEKQAYLNRAIEQYGSSHALKRIDITIDEKDPEYIDIKYTFLNRPFDRIRRITGYLVGTLDRFNDAKKAEEHDRVKHAESPHHHCVDCACFKEGSGKSVGWCSDFERSRWLDDEVCEKFTKASCS